MGLFALFVQDVPNDVSIQLGRQSFIRSKVVDQVGGHFNFCVFLPSLYENEYIIPIRYIREALFSLLSGFLYFGRFFFPLVSFIKKKEFILRLALKNRGDQLIREQQQLYVPFCLPLLLF